MPSDPVTLIETLTGCAPEEVAQLCTIGDLRAARQLCEEAIELKEAGPQLVVVGRQELTA